MNQDQQHPPRPPSGRRESMGSAVGLVGHSASLLWPGGRQKPNRAINTPPRSAQRPSAPQQLTCSGRLRAGPRSHEPAQADRRARREAQGAPPHGAHLSHTQTRTGIHGRDPHHPDPSSHQAFVQGNPNAFLSVPRSCGTRGILRSRCPKSWSHATCSAPSSPASAVSGRCRLMPEQDDSMVPDHQPDPCSLDPG